MAYNNQIHNRKSIRLKGYDYSQEGLYFITICCNNMFHRFGHIENSQMILNEFGKIAYNEWLNLTNRFQNLELDVFQIMPNHFHSIIEITYNIETIDNEQENNILPTNVSSVIGAYKSIVTNECLKIYKLKNETMGKLWQRNYYEHIIRNEQAYQNISNYIIKNPEKWQEDKFYQDNIA